MNIERSSLTTHLNAELSERGKKRCREISTETTSSLKRIKLDKGSHYLTIFIGQPQLKILSLKPVDARKIALATKDIVRCILPHLFGEGSEYYLGSITEMEDFKGLEAFAVCNRFLSEIILGYKKQLTSFYYSNLLINNHLDLYIKDVIKLLFIKNLCEERKYTYLTFLAMQFQEQLLNYIQGNEDSDEVIKDAVNELNILIKTGKANSLVSSILMFFNNELAITEDPELVFTLIVLLAKNEWFNGSMDI